jgi:hypothetical protein
MLFIRIPPLLVHKPYRAKGHAVQGLEETDALKRLCDEMAFQTRLQELEELKTQAQQEDDSDKEVLAPTVKKRKLDSNGVAQHIDGAHGEDSQNVAPRNKKPAGCKKRNEKFVLPKEKKAKDFNDFFKLPCNARSEPNAQRKATQRLRGSLRSKLSNEKKPLKLQPMDQLREASKEIAKYLVDLYNHPDSSVDALLELISTTGGRKCIDQIQNFLEIKELGDLGDPVVQKIFVEFQGAVQNYAQSVEKETRKYVMVSQQTLSCIKVHIDRQSKLYGCYSGPPELVAAKLPGVPRKLCKNLRNLKGINVVAFMAADSSLPIPFKAMPGPWDAFPEGYIFLGCEECQGKGTAGFHCTEWLDSIGCAHGCRFLLANSF